MERKDKDNEMNNRRRQFLAVLLCAAIFGNSACSTTTQRLGPTQAAMNHYGIGKGDTVLIRYANESDPRSSSRSEKIRIIGISKVGITGTGDAGKAVTVGYDEIFQIEHQHTGPVMDIQSPADAAEMALWGVVYAAFGAATAAICVGAPAECLMIVAEMGD
jgi:hypothetical protein